MAKTGFELSDLSSLKGPLRDRGWVLCIGAGTSGSLFPDWQELVRRLMIDDSAVIDPGTVLIDLRKAGFSLDALIQAAKARLKLSDEQFAERLSDRLYASLPPDPVRSRLLTALAAKAPGAFAKAKWQLFIDDIKALDRVPSALDIAEVVVRARSIQTAPKAILSFNAEPLLYSLINAYSAVRNNKPLPSPQAPPPEPQCLDPITRSISTRASGRIPYYFCHGLLRVAGVHGGLLEEGSPEKLVFSEAEYLSLANASFSWQAATFASLAIQHSLVFVGISFTDSNVRKWLSWMYENRRAEIQKRLDLEGRRTGTPPKIFGSGASTLHYWLKKRPSTPGEQEWLEALVGHLGVRIIWLDNWNQAGPAFATLAGTS